MKKILMFILCILVFIPLFLCYDKLAYERAMFSAGLAENSNIEEVGCCLEVKVVEIRDNSILVSTTQDYPYYFDVIGCYEYLFYSTDILEIDLNNTEVNCELFVDKRKLEGE